MGSDLFALSALAKELNEQLKNARVDKIQQTDLDEIRFFVRANGKNHCLVASCNANVPRLHLTSSKKQSPFIAYGFCMLLRKYLLNAAVEEIKILNCDRVIEITFLAKNELGDKRKFKLIAELIGRYSNLIFTTENNTVLYAAKKMREQDGDIKELKQLIYSPMPQTKISYLTASIDFLHNFNGGDLKAFILSNLSGFSLASVKELLFRANVNEVTDGALSDEEITRIASVLDDFKTLKDFSPCIIDGEVLPIVYLSKNDKDVRKFDSMSKAYDNITLELDENERNRQRLKALNTQAKQYIKRVENNIEIDKKHLSECEGMEKYRVYGELIVNNIYKIKRGDKTLHCLNYYVGEEIDITLDPTLSPSENSATYFAKYNKLKRTKEFTEKKLLRDLENLEYAHSILDEIENLPYSTSVEPIEEELFAVAGTKQQKTKTKVRKPKADPPYRYNVEGFTVLKGKNNVQNDEITFKLASSYDLWLHVKDGPSPHVVVFTDGKKIPDSVLKIVGEIAASTKSAPCDVVYTIRKNVKRQPQKAPGQVIYTDYQTMLSTPNKHEELLIEG